MVDSQVFGVRDPATGEIGWCCVIGAAGELSGLIVYRGEAGFDAYRRLQSGEFLPDEGAFGQDALMFAFVDRADMSKVELQRLKRLGFSFRGPRRWPQFESHASGRLPIPLTDAEAERMLHTLRATKEVALALRDVPAWLEPDPQGRLHVYTQDGDGWRSERVAAPAPIPTPVPTLDLVRAERTRRTLKPGRAVLECDLCPLPIVIDERKDHAYAPASFFLVDAASGTILHQQMGPPAERHAMAQVELMKALESLGLAPAALRVKRPALARALAPLGAALGIEIQLVEELPAMDEVHAMAAEFFRRKPAGRGRR